MKRITCLAAAAAALALCAPVTAAPLEANKAAALRARVVGPEGGGKASVLPQAFNLSASADKTEASISASHSWEDNRNGDTQGKLSFNSLSLRLSVPIDEDSGEGVFHTDKHPGNGSAAELTYVRHWLPGTYAPPNPDVQRQMLDLARARCRGKLDASLHEKACNKAYFSEVEKYLTRQDLEGWKDDPFLTQILWNLGGSAKLAYKSYDYRDLETLKEASSERTPYSLSAFLELIGPAKSFGVGAVDAVVSLKGGVEYGQDYKKSKTQTLCLPAPASGPIECFSGPFDRPKREKGGKVFGVARWSPAPNAEQLIGWKGLELAPTYDLEEDRFSVDASIYLVADSEGRARGGLRLSWTEDDDDPATDDDNFTAGIFVGVPF